MDLNQMQKPEQYRGNQSWILKWSLIIALVIVLNLFFNYALSLVYPAPKYEAYCPTEQVINPPTTSAKCVEVGGQWTQNTYPKVDSNGEVIAPQVQGYCNPTFTCQKDYDAVRKVYERNVFVILVVLGVVSIAVGMMLKAVDVVSIGLSFGGVISLIIASMRYWSEAENILKVIILGVALVVLIWLGIKRFKN